MRWFENHRIEWIVEMIHIYGFINREHVQRKFGVTPGQVAVDLRKVMQRHPCLMIYNTSLKRYEAATPHPADGKPATGGE